jgi:hypothetical protein
MVVWLMEVLVDGEKENHEGKMTKENDFPLTSFHELFFVLQGLDYCEWSLCGTKKYICHLRSQKYSMAKHILRSSTELFYLFSKSSLCRIDSS